MRGRVYKLGDNIDTDVIIPARYLTTTDPQELRRHCFEDLDPAFLSRIQAGDFILAGKNFGCGSSREHAALAIKGVGIAGVIAASFARIFYRNGFNLGLPLLECPEAVGASEAGDELEVHLAQGTIKNLTKERLFRAEPIPPFMLELMADGGLMPHIARRLGLKKEDV